MSIESNAEKVTQSLMAVVAANGNVSEAQRELTAAGVEVPLATLRQWKNEVHSEQYHRLTLRFTQELENEIIELARQNAKRAAEVTYDAVEATAKQLETGRVADPSATARNLAHVQTQNIDKVLAMTGRPSQITEQRDMKGLIETMIAKGILKTPAIEGTAEDA